MLNALYQSIVGTAPTSATGSAHGQNTAGQGMTLGQLQGLANQQFNAAYGQIVNNNLQAQQQNQQLAAIQAQYNSIGVVYNSILAQNQKQWMVNGVAMTWDEFLDAVCPDQDDPHRTYLTLKYKGVK